MTTPTTQTTFVADTFTDPDTDETFVTIPIEMLKQLNWGEGTAINVRTERGRVTMTRANEVQLFAVETISMFRHVYLVRAENEEHASDAVAMEEAESYFQQHLGETLVHSRKVSNADVVRLLQETEQPDMTLEKLESGHWLQNCVHDVVYSPTC